MHLPKNKLSTFSLEDFEKGLMLPGLITPANVQELNERTRLIQYEKELKEQNRQTYFKRIVLAAEIANQLHEEPTFGRVKFQKLVYMCEHIASLDLQDRYVKQAAGPFDNKFMHSIEKEFKSHKWFDVIKKFEKGMTLTKYIPLENCTHYKSYYQSYYGNVSEQIDNIIQLFRKPKTDIAEISATLFYCNLEIRDTNQLFTIELLLKLFFEWSERKKIFSRTQVLSTWEWMKEKSLIK
jgi:hypothetical protein